MQLGERVGRHTVGDGGRPVTRGGPGGGDGHILRV